MTKVAHTFHLSCPPKAILEALTDANHIQKWWTTDANVLNSKGVFKWKNHGWTVELDIEKRESDQEVVWRCTKSNMQNTDAWEGSTMTFKLKSDSLGTTLQFLQSNYKNSPCYDVCHNGWRFVLGKSLKSYLETGSGMPYSAN